MKRVDDSISRRFGARFASLLTAVACAALLLVPGRAAAEIALVGATSPGTQGALSVTLDLTLPAGVAAGDLLLAQVTAEDPCVLGLLNTCSLTVNTITPPAGWTLLRMEAGGTEQVFNLLGLVVIGEYRLRQAIYYRVAGLAEPASYTWGFSQTNGNAAGGIMAFRGVDPLNPVDAHSGIGGLTNSVTIPGLTTTLTHDVLAAFVGVRNNFSITPPGTMTAVYNNTGAVSIAATTEAQAAAAASGNRTATFSGSASHIGQLVALRPALDHLEVIHDGAGLTCGESIRVLACVSSADCAKSYTGTVAATLSPLSGWRGGNAVTVSAGSADFILTVPTPGLVTVGATATSPTAPFPTICRDGLGGTSCDITFFDSGFAFDVPNHASETLQTVTVSAVKKADIGVGCVPAFTNRTVAVDFTCGHADPATGTQLVRMGQGNTATSCPAAGSAQVSLLFDANGVAQNVQFIYGDTGAMSLTATYTGAVGTPDAGLVMSGVDSFVAKPAGFILSAIQTSGGAANPAAADAAGGGFVKAGEPFSVTVTAVNFAGAATPNFGREATAEGVKLTPALVAPAGGALPALSFTSGFGAFSGGAATGTDFAWPEAGIITLTPSVGDGDYLGAGDVTGTTSGNVGRFYPASFQVTHTVTPANSPAAGTPFTYAGIAAAPVKSGQPFVVSGSVTPQALGGTTTTNYVDDAVNPANDFAKLTTAGFTAAAHNAGSHCATPPCPNAGTVTFAVDSLTFLGGVGSFSEGGATFSFPAQQGPDTLHLMITATDSDGVTGTVDVPAITTAFRVGRVRLQDAYGPQTATLDMRLTVEQFNGSAFVANGDDTSTSITAVALGSWAGTLQAGESSVITALPLTPQPTGTITLGAPGFGADSNSGSVVVTPTVPAWLQFDFNGDGVIEDPGAKATFGIFRGDDRMIHWSEP